MRIDFYSFGKMVIDGVTYTSDLLLFPDRVEADWWREQGHLLAPDDILDAVQKAAPARLVVGTGKFGIMRVDRSLADLLSKDNIALHAAPTKQAAAIYNRLGGEGERVMGAFHLTC